VAKRLASLAEFRRQLADADARAEAATAKLRLAEHEVERAKIEAQSVALERGALLQIVEGMEILAQSVHTVEIAPRIGSNGVAVMAGHPEIRGREAVRRVLRDSGRAMRQRDLVEAVKERGWIDPNARNPDASIRVAARRLVEDGEVEKIGTGVYRWRRTLSDVGLDMGLQQDLVHGHQEAGQRTE
jgi:hypothetical protein